MLNASLSLPGMALASTLMPAAEPRLRVPPHYRLVWSENLRAARRPTEGATGLLCAQGPEAWAYGFFELRARMPRGVGLHTRVALRPLGFRAPQDGEMVWVLQDGADPTRVGARIHTAAGHGSRALGGSTRVPSACSRFHRYQLHWTPEAIEFAIDGFAFFRYARMDAGERVWPFDRPHHLVIECAVRPGTAGDAACNPAMEIDTWQVHQPLLELFA